MRRNKKYVYRQIGGCICCGLGAMAWLNLQEPVTQPAASVTDTASAQEEAAAPTQTPALVNQSEPVEQQKLEAALRDSMAQDSAQYEAYVWLPDWQKPLIIGNHQQSSASIIKIYILGTAFELAGHGQLDLQQAVTVHQSDMVGGAGVINGRSGEPQFTIRELLKLMITESDNTATNVLMDTIGVDRIRSFMTAHGYSQSVLQRKMMDFNALKRGEDNFTTAADVGKFFRELRTHQVVSPAADQAMIDILFGQTDTECFPAALPEAKIAHKTGELEGVYHDAGIIYEGGQGYVLCIMSEHSHGRSNTLVTMRTMAKLVDAAYHESLGNEAG